MRQLELFEASTSKDESLWLDFSYSFYSMEELLAYIHTRASDTLWRQAREKSSQGERREIETVLTADILR